MARVSEGTSADVQKSSSDLEEKKKKRSIISVKMEISFLFLWVGSANQKLSVIFHDRFCQQICLKCVCVGCDVTSG